MGRQAAARLVLGIGLDVDLGFLFPDDRRRHAGQRFRDDLVDDINVQTLGFQIRYRYELAPLSYLYVVYGRGGFDQEPTDDGARSLLRDSFQLRDDEQLLVKFSYRFEN